MYSLKLKKKLVGSLKIKNINSSKQYFSFAFYFNERTCLTLELSCDVKNGKWTILSPEYRAYKNKKMKKNFED